MSIYEFFGLFFPPVLCLFFGYCAVLKLVGRRCASWYSIGCTFGILSSTIGLMSAVFFM